LLLIAGYNTDITKTCDPLYTLPTDPTPHRLFISVHYYTPWQFCGMTEDADWGKMALTWGTDQDKAELERLFDMMSEFSVKHDIPAFIGEFGVTDKKESASRARYMSAVFETALAKRLVPILWDTGNDFSRRPPHAPSAALELALENLKTPKTGDVQPAPLTVP
jgi:endoglucanase